MNKTSQKVTKDHKKVEAGRRGRKSFMNNLKESILNDAKKDSGDTTNASNETANASNETTSAANTNTNPATSTNNITTTRSNDTYVYGVGILAVFSISTCVFFTYNTFQPKIKKLVNEKQEQPPKKRHML